MFISNSLKYIEFRGNGYLDMCFYDLLVDYLLLRFY